MTTIPPRRWFQFSIREVALLVLAMAIALGWYRERQELREELYEKTRTTILLSEAVRCVKTWPPDIKPDYSAYEMYGEIDGVYVGLVVSKYIQNVQFTRINCQECNTRKAPDPSDYSP